MVTTVAWGGISPRTASASTTTASTAVGDEEKVALLQAIKDKAGEEEILQCIDRLIMAATRIPSQPQQLRLLERIDGEWTLLWSRGAQQFSPLLQLPPPLTPTSYQLVGSAATPIVGSDRIAQVLTSGILGPTQLYLSSGIVEYNNKEGKDDNMDVVDSSSSILQIRPPFRFQIGWPSSSSSSSLFTLIDSDSDADFRALNARTEEAQGAPPNLYQQLYVDDQLRISKIIQGDPVIVGATFVHVKKEGIR